MGNRRPCGTMRRLRFAASLVACGFAVTVMGGCATTATPQTDAGVKAGSTAAARLAALPPRTPSRPGADPAQLRGMPAQMVRALLGEPRFVRKEPPAEVWLYADGSCVFHVFMYDGPETGGYRVAHYDIASASSSIRLVSECFASLLKHADHRPIDS